MALARLPVHRLAKVWFASALRPPASARVFAPSFLAVPILIFLLSGSAAGAPSCDVTTDPSSGFAMGPTSVRIIVESASSAFGDAGTIRIWSAIDYAQQPRLIGQASSGSFGTSASQTITFSTEDSHHIWVACQAASGTTTAETDFRILPPSLLFVAFGAIVLLGLVAKATAAAATASVPPTAMAHRETTASVAPTSAISLSPSESAMTVGPLSETQSPRLLSEQAPTAQRSKVERCHDAVGDREALIGLLLRKRELESKITVEYLQKGTTARALLQKYRAMCDTKLNTWLATADNSVEVAAGKTYKALSFVNDIGEIGRFADEHLLDAVIEMPHVTASGIAGAIWSEKAALRKPIAKFAVGEAAQHVYDHVAEQHSELISKLGDALSDEIAAYTTLASAHNDSLRRWHADRGAAMEALDREIEAAHRALASSHWDCHGRLLPLDDAALHLANADSLASEWRSAIGHPSDLEVPVEIGLRSPR